MKHTGGGGRGLWMALLNIPGIPTRYGNESECLLLSSSRIRTVESTTSNDCCVCSNYYRSGTSYFFQRNQCFQPYIGFHFLLVYLLFVGEQISLSALISSIIKKPNIATISKSISKFR